MAAMAAAPYDMAAERPSTSGFTDASRSPPGTAQSAQPGAAAGGAPARAASEIRFKEIAHYVGLNLVRNPSLTRSAPRALRLPASGGVSAGASLESSLCERLPATPSMAPSLDVLQNSGVHQHGRAERLKCQLEWLKAERRAEQEHIRKLDSCVSDSMLAQKRAQQRVAKHQEMRHLHAQRASEVDGKIKSLLERLETSEGADRSATGMAQALAQHPSRDSFSLEAPPSAGSPPGTAGEVEAFASSVGILKQSAERAAAPAPARKTSVGQQPMGGSTRSLQASLAAQDLPLTAVPRSAPAGAVGPRRASRAILVPPRAPLAASDEDAAGARDKIRQELKCAARRRLLETGPPATVSPLFVSQSPHDSENRYLARVAFQTIDLNGSGNISSQEFADGLSRMGVNWQQITGFTRGRDVFTMFDEDKDYHISFKELFPEEVPDEAERPSTPDFCRMYIRQRNYDIKGSCWQPASREEEVKIVREFSDRNDEAAAKRAWMRSTMRRLKTRGKSDGRCREVVAEHLPRGTGPRDQEGVSTFTKVDLKNCKKAYSDDVNAPTRRLTKLVGDFKDQRREQKRIFDKLYAVTEGLKQREEEAAKLSSLGNGLTGILAKGKEVKEEPKPTLNPQVAKLLGAAGLEAPEVEKLFEEYIKFSDSSQHLGKRGFARLVQALLPNTDVQGAKADDWWSQVRSDSVDFAGGVAEDAEGSTKSQGSRGATCSFAQFCMWWVKSKARSGG